jgi:hypothetical protein
MDYKKIIKLILFCVSGFLVFITVIFYFIYDRNNQPQQFNCRIPVPEYICGTEDLPEEVQKGKEIFNRVCAACHKLDAISTGPALRNTDSIIYRKWIVERNSIIDSSKFYKQGIDYHHYLSREGLDSLDIKNLFEYIN